MYSHICMYVYAVRCRNISYLATISQLEPQEIGGEVNMFVCVCDVTIVFL